jgi:short-subunit dehydrogenase
MKPVVAIAGMGEGIALAIARRFGREGFAIAMLARNEKKLQYFQQSLEAEGYEAQYFIADAGNETSLESAFASIRETLGNPEVLIYNAAVAKMENILNETVDSLTNDFKINVAGALAAVKAVLPAMRAQGKGTILFTGGGFALYPNPEFGSLSIGKAGIRSLGKMLGEALKSDGIRSGMITVAGTVSPDDLKYNPEGIAENYWAFHTAQEPDIEVIY